MTTPVPPPATLIFLHGHDDDPAPAADLGRAMAGLAWNVVVPAGPVPTGAARRAWWRSDDDGAPDPDDVAAAIALVDDLIDRYAGATPVVLGGFSQGGALALARTLTGRGAALAGGFAVGAWLADLVGLPTDLDAVAARGTPVLIAHGADDEDVPLLLGRSAARLLDRHAIPLTFVPLDVGHVVAPFVPAIHEWVAAVARGERPSTSP